MDIYQKEYSKNSYTKKPPESVRRPVWGASILCTSSSSVYWLISNKRTKHSLNTHKPEKKRLFREDILSLSGSVANTASVKHTSFVSKLGGIHYRSTCVLTYTRLLRTVDISNISVWSNVHIFMKALCATLIKQCNLSPFSRHLFIVSTIWQHLAKFYSTGYAKQWN